MTCLVPTGTTAKIDYFDADANTHEVNATLPWSITISTTLPAVSGNIMAQGDGDEIGCRITVDGMVRDERQYRRREPADLLPGEVRMTETSTKHAAPHANRPFLPHAIRLFAVPIILLWVFGRRRRQRFRAAIGSGRANNIQLR